MGFSHGRGPLPTCEVELSYKCREIISWNERSGMDTLSHHINHLRYDLCAVFTREAMFRYVELTLSIRTNFYS